MNGQIAYEAYRNFLNSRTRRWHELKALPEHENKSDDDLDAWIKENFHDRVDNYFMGDYEAMPEHSKQGWNAFAEHVSDGPEAAWHAYCEVAKLNFHQQKQITLPRYVTLASDQQAAIESAVQKVLDQSFSFKH